MTEPSKYIYHSTLKQRPGWSDKVIAHFLPEPDLTRDNPHYRSAAPSKLYLLSKVEQIEEKEYFKQQALLTNRRKLSAGLATETKRANLLHYVAKLVIKVPVMEVDVLTDLACAHYNARKAYRQQEYGGDWQEASADSDPCFLSRITTNYLRHMLTRYEAELERIAGKVGVDEAYYALKTKVNEAIINQYPHLDKY